MAAHGADLMDSACVVHLIASNFYGGPERQIVTHARQAAEQGFSFCIMSFAEKGNSNEILLKAEEAGISTRLLGSRGSFDPSCVKRLAGELKELGAGVLVSHGYKANVVGRLATWMAGIPKVAVSRGWTRESARVRLYERLDRVFLKLADHVVAVSQGQADKLLAAGLKPGRVSVIRNSIDLPGYPSANGNQVRRELGIPPDGILVASAGRLSPEKNHRDLVEAASLALLRDHRLYFAVFGEGALRGELEAQIRSKGLQDRFLLPGFHKQMRRVMHEIDIFVLPSLTEGLPNVALEAFACAKPVVATRVGGSPEVVEDGSCGYLVEPGDPRALCERILALAASGEARRTFGRRGRCLVERRFDFSAQTREYAHLYRRLGGFGTCIGSRGESR